MRRFLLAPVVALLLLGATASPALMARSNLFTINNFRLNAAPPGFFVPNVNGRAVPAGHIGWTVTFDTTGLPNNQELVNVVVQYHYTGVQLGATGQPNQGQMTNPDGTVTQIDGGTFTGWIDDCQSDLQTTHLDKLGNVVHSAFLSCDLNRIQNAYPDTARFVVLSTPGYPSIPSVTFDLN